MAFALWIEDDLAWAQGLHEYRPLGVAVIAATDRFHPRDFQPRRPAPPRSGAAYAGLYASLEDVNRHLGRARQRRLQATPAWI